MQGRRLTVDGRLLGAKYQREVFKNEGTRLPPVLPIMLYNGQATSTAKTGLTDLIEPGLPEQLRRWQPQIR